MVNLKLASGASAINDLSDVTITNPLNGEVLTYNSSSAIWINQTASSGVDVKVAVDSAATSDFIGASSSDGVLRTSSPITYTDGGDFITLGIDQTAIDHDVLLNFQANEHIDHTTVTLTAGDGLSGGGDISANRSFAIDWGTGAGQASSDDIPIGTPPGDSDITDGLFSWTSSTIVADALDDINELMISLSPPPAPDLDDIDIDSSGTSGKLSFGSSGSISGYTNVTGIGSLGSVDVDGSFTNSGDRVGIFTATHSDITGTLNEDVSASTQTPTAAYPANAFPDVGQTLSLEINGTVTATVDLSSTDAAIDQGTGTSGFSVSAKTANKFSNGDSSTLFFHRTGTWRIDSADLNLRNGWNYVRVLDNQGTPISTNYVDWVRDAETTATSFSSEALDTLTMMGSKYLSGVQYHTGGTAAYDITINNAYRNTYSLSSSATNHNGTNVSIADASMAAQSGDEAATITITNKTATINATRLIDSSITISTTQDRTVQSDLTSTGASISGILMDNASASPTDTFDDFDDEGYRLPSNVSLTSTSYSSGPNNGPVTWDETISLISATAGYSDGLQVVNDKIEYPVTDWNAVTNGPAGNPNYTTASGNRVYLRYFYDSSSRQNFIFNFNITSTSFVSVATGPSGNNLTCEILAPNTTQDSGGTIEFKDMVTAYTNDDSIGAYSSSVGSTIPTNWGVTLGTRSTSTSGNAWVIRITAAASWTGSINSVTCTPQ